MFLLICVTDNNDNNMILVRTPGCIIGPSPMIIGPPYHYRPEASPRADNDMLGP